ncbi:MAG: trp operon repressor [Rhabdochlamydiaceae bacterium]|nr:trp operon repressor [Candidatus Amphrikana amoebophyrae]
MNTELEGWWRKFKSILTKINTEKEMEIFLDLFLTISETEDIARRLMILKAIFDDEMPQREMKDKLHVSIGKVSRGSNALKKLDYKTKKRVEALLK